MRALPSSKHHLIGSLAAQREGNVIGSIGLLMDQMHRNVAEHRLNARPGSGVRGVVKLTLYRGSEHSVNHHG